MDGPVSTERLVLDAFAALKGDGGLDAQTVQQVLAIAAKALARALPGHDFLYNPALDGPPMSPEEIKTAAIDARSFLEWLADLLGDPADPDWAGDDFAFAGALKKRPDWKPPAEPTPAQSKRRRAAVRVYELMAEHCFDTGQRPQQEAAISSVMEELGLARSKVTQGLKEYRESKSWLQSWVLDDDGELRFTLEREKMARTHYMIASLAMAREWFKRNPDAHFVGVTAGSAVEKELLSRESPHDPPS